MRPLHLKPVGYYLLDRTVKPQVRLLTKPCLRKIVHLLETVKGAIPGKKVALDVAHHPLHLALGPGTVGSLGTNCAAGVTGSLVLGADQKRKS